MADTTTPTSQQNGTPLQDLQINLEDAPKEETKAKEEIKQPEIDLNLDLNLSDAPKDDNRLQNEDKKNETETPELTIDIPAQEETKTVEEHSNNPSSSEISTQEIKIEEPKVMESTPEKVSESKIEEIKPELSTDISGNTGSETIAQSFSEITSQEQTIEEPKIEISTPDTANSEKTQEIKAESLSEISSQETKVEKIEEPIVDTKNTETKAEVSTTISEQTISQADAQKALNEDMKQINEIESTTNAGGLAPEAKPQAPKPQEEAPKTFDLDAMLGTTPVPTIIQQPGVAPTSPAPIEQQISAPTMPVQQAVMQMPPIPTIFTQPVPATPAPQVQQATTHTPQPHHSPKGVKALLFVVLFIALGFGTFFILKTMYPLEFNTMFHASGGTPTQEMIEEEIAIDTGAIQEASGATEEITSETITGDTTQPEESSDDSFGELNDLETSTTTSQQEETPISKLTNYVNQGNEFLAKGKELNNSTVIKYGLYITKKATSFLEKIANGEEINNLSGYLAQFDQYISKLEEIIGQPAIETPTTTEEIAPAMPETNGVIPQVQKISPTTDTTDGLQETESIIPQPTPENIGTPTE